MLCPLYCRSFVMIWMGSSSAMQEDLLKQLQGMRQRLDQLGVRL